MSTTHTYQRPGAAPATPDTLWRFFDAAILDAIECGANEAWRMEDFMRARGFGLLDGSANGYMTALRRDIGRRLATLRHRRFIRYDRKTRVWVRIGDAAWNASSGWSWIPPLVGVAIRVKP
jgi:hypothetical protein